MYANLPVAEWYAGEKRPSIIRQSLSQVLTLDQLRDKLSEMANHEPHLGLDPTAASSEDPTISLETERFLLGQKVRKMQQR